MALKSDVGFTPCDKAADEYQLATDAYMRAIRRFNGAMVNGSDRNCGHPTQSSCLCDVERERSRYMNARAEYVKHFDGVQPSNIVSSHTQVINKLIADNESLSKRLEETRNFLEDLVRELSSQKSVDSEDAKQDETSLDIILAKITGETS